jgi:hypothetical protein
VSTRFLLYAIVGGGLAYVLLDESGPAKNRFSLGLDAQAALKTVCLGNLIGLEGAAFGTKMKYCECVVQTQRERWHQKDLQDFVKAHANAYYALLDNPRTSRRGLASYQASEREPRLMIFLQQLSITNVFADMKDPELKFAERIDFHWKEAQQACLKLDDASGGANPSQPTRQDF